MKEDDKKGESGKEVLKEGGRAIEHVCHVSEQTTGGGRVYG